VAAWPPETIVRITLVAALPAARLPLTIKCSRMSRLFPLVADNSDTVCLTDTGRLFYDLVTLAFYPERIKEWLGERHKTFHLHSAEVRCELTPGRGLATG